MQPPEEENSVELEAAYQQLESEQQQLTDDDMECTGRIVTELVEAGNAPLPDRFMYAMRAIRGEFTPADGVADTHTPEHEPLRAALKHTRLHDVKQDRFAVGVLLGRGRDGALDLAHVRHRQTTLSRTPSIRIDRGQP